MLLWLQPEHGPGPSDDGAAVGQAAAGCLGHGP